MNQAYKPIQHEADHLFHRTESMIDDHQDHAAEVVSRLSMDVRELTESDHTPRAIEAKILQVQQQLKPLAAAPGRAMTPRDAHTLIDEYEKLRREVRKLPNY